MSPKADQAAAPSNQEVPIDFFYFFLFIIFLTKKGCSLAGADPGVDPHETLMEHILQKQ